MTSDAKSVDEYLRSLAPDRGEALQAVREVILANLAQGFEEVMQYGMIGYVIPLACYPRTYNGKPLELAGLASQKNYMALYLMNVYGNPDIEHWFKQQFEARGKKLDMGKSCVRFKRLEDLPLGLIGETISRTSVEDFLRRYELSRK